MVVAMDAKERSEEYIQRDHDRRANSNTVQVQFPLLDSDFNIVRKDRRRLLDRRRTNLKLKMQESQPIQYTSELHIIYGDESFYLDKETKCFNLGRSLQSSLRVDNKYVSKHHAYIEYTNNEFVLHDKSKNGTFIETAELGKIHLRDQRAYLVGEGKISFGKSAKKSEAEEIYFNCY